MSFSIFGVSGLRSCLKHNRTGFDSWDMHQVCMVGAGVRSHF